MFTSTSLSGKNMYRLAMFAAGVSFMLYGYDAGVLGGVQSTEPFLEAMGYPTDAYVIPMIASSYSLAATVSSVVIMFVGMPMGRKRCIQFGTVLIIIGAVLQATSYSVAQIIVGRLVCGFGMGFISATVPIYIAELSTKSTQRGPAVGWQVCILISGIPLAYWVDLGFTRMTNQLSWRFPIAFQGVFGLIVLVCFFFLPDTPRWYYVRGRMDEADLVLSLLHRAGIDDPNVQSTRREILASIELETHTTHPFQVLDLFWQVISIGIAADRSDLKVGRRLRTGFLLYALSNLMGINMLVYFTTIIFANVGLSPFLSQVLAGVMNTMLALGTIAMPLTLERLGRRFLMFWGAIGCSVCMLIFVIMICLPEPKINTATQWTAVAFVVMWNLFNGWGWIGVPWLYPTEIAPLEQRHIGGAMAALGEWLFAFVTVFAGGIGISRVGPKIWIWNLLFNVIAAIFVWFYCPETTGLGLEEIDLLFASDEIKESYIGRQAIHDTSAERSTDENEKTATASITEDLHTEAV